MQWIYISLTKNMPMNFRLPAGGLGAQKSRIFLMSIPSAPNMPARSHCSCEPAPASNKLALIAPASDILTLTPLLPPWLLLLLHGPQLPDHATVLSNAFRAQLKLAVPTSALPTTSNTLVLNSPPVQGARWYEFRASSLLTTQLC